ncbi:MULTISPECIES: peptidoglycan D,D-transpeptidase FtsI family protein [Mameliella]|uniref:Penicillin-binding protein n=1 Tax=Mameliella alba TaxID=561184 RepID=A0A0B3SCA8_9RHOB|nr:MULTISPECIES: penicillin-binding protein 2 [Mameliella]MCR9273449.1 penicillin-binding protein 2 [Paracoccaceae bacterium]KHQ54331.1 Penicillin-binding protein [Mameliella alba]OWV48102.1 cell division protein FtsI [Mameliella alba]OWV54928.1 cell division protein FtsI [Mameliella alba]PTR40131.1 cell division protein FtsI (penicillin-binding protein 3) [Mameliella alba]
MTRIPLRPLARILEARQNGENPDAIERENRRLRHEEMRDRMRLRAEGRLLVLAMMFLCAYGVVGARMGMLSASEPEEPRAQASGASIIASRADIVDRHGRVLATNMSTHSLYAHPQQMIDPLRAAEELARIFPEMEAEALARRFTDPKRKFLWVKQKLSPEQMQAVHDIGEPGLLFGPREMRLYPNGAIASHVLGGARFGRQGVASAEVVGTAGIEKYLDEELRDPAREGAPLALSIDLSVQAATEEVLDAGMKMLNARGAASVLMDVHTGEVIAIASLPDFDPNDRPRPPVEGQPDDSPLFNRAVQGLYELGSTFKILTVAQALQMGLVHPETMIDTSPPYEVLGFKVGEFNGKNYGTISVTDVIAQSSNRGTAKIVMMIGRGRQQEFYRNLGMFEPPQLEIVEAKGAKPLVPSRWTDLSAVTISYGHGISVSPLHLAAAYAMIGNGGHIVEPTLLKRDRPRVGDKLLRDDVAEASLRMLRKVVIGEKGTATFAEVPGYRVGGKTGTAEKPKKTGGYHKDKVIATFAALFPTDAPRYALVVMLDEPVETTGSKPRRTAGWTAVPVAAEMIARIAPLLGLPPEYDKGQVKTLTTASD